MESLEDKSSSKPPQKRFRKGKKEGLLQKRIRKRNKQRLAAATGMSQMELVRAVIEIELPPELHRVRRGRSFVVKDKSPA